MITTSNFHREPVPTGALPDGLDVREASELDGGQPVAHHRPQSRLLVGAGDHSLVRSGRTA